MRKEDDSMELYCLGDSLTFGYGVKPAQRWIALASGEGWTLHNHGVCGDTTGGMLVRLHTGLLPLLRREGGAVLLCGGDNDIFYSGCASAAKGNMGAMVHQLLGLGVRPILAEIQALVVTSAAGNPRRRKNSR